MAAKKAAPKKSGASDKAKKAQSRRMTAQTLSSWRNAQPKRGQKAASIRMEEQFERNKGAVYSGKETESGRFYSTGLMNKEMQKIAARKAKELKDASKQMKQGVTKSGGYSEPLLGIALRDLRGAKSAKFKAEQAVKKTGGSLSRNARGKTTKRNAK
jgi:hypothetical protein